MSQSNAFPTIDRLRGRENYVTWAFAMKKCLQLDGLWKCVLGEDDDTDRNDRAIAKMVMCIDPVNYVHIQDTQDAKQMWEKLRDAFEDSGLTRKVGLLRRMVTTKLEDCKSMEQYVTQIMTAAHQLTGIGLKMDEEWIGTILLAGLPNQYQPMIMVIESSGMRITGDAIKTKLLQEEKANVEIVMGARRK